MRSHFIIIDFYKSTITFLREVSKLIKNPGKIFYRLFRAGYIYKQNRLFAKHIIYNPERHNTIILSSYPKTGSTFFRFVWLNIISLMELDGKEIDFVLLDDYMPFEGFFNDIKKDWNFRSLPCLIKCTSRYSKRYKNFKAIHLFRNPLDTMVSGYHFYSNNIGGPEDVGFSWIEDKILNFYTKPFKGNFSEFLSENLDGYCSHFKFWMESKAVPASYETLISENASCYFDHIFKALGLTVEDKILDGAIKRSDKEKLKNKKHSKKIPKLRRMHFIRDGSVGQWKKYCGKKELEFVMKKLSFYGLDRIDSFPDRYKPLMVGWPWSS